ncbi:hypothetical protein RG47T_1332 [Mucilaginibacter polytrichastri]|uniref:Uncharacterized protein n=1 Tax=Mucilaginibacter polytrichastri TaxID=1302689 RepID=A0A1Q5ZVW5_9SPHI|nr:hypothetical protein RG47T_1332 [Mucilaginibacter polytrichastri]
MFAPLVFHVILNGKKLAETGFTHQEIMQGSKLTSTIFNQPDKQFCITNQCLSDIDAKH